ncbi:velvet factor-domain-containing protein [Obelidium mucronatum]|nr:velvet factor-domain-containing protein [Obelidium mucronatum]
MNQFSAASEMKSFSAQNDHDSSACLAAAIEYHERLPLHITDEESTIKLEIIQEPQQTRVCGFQLADRRPIHPPPIIKLHGVDPSEAGPFIMFASLYSADRQSNMSFTSKSGSPVIYTPIQGEGTFNVAVTDGYSKSMILMGQLICLGELLNDTENNPGIFFIYNDLAVRSSGLFRLKFALYKMHAMRGSTPPIAVAFSSVFQVYSPKEFPGVTETTELSKCFARQGVNIRMKYALDSL